MEDGDKFTTENLKLPDNFAPEALPSSSTLSARHRRQLFIRMPLIWADRLNGARLVATYKVALHLLHEEFKDHGISIRLANGALEAKGVTRWQKWRAIEELEGLGLIEVKRRPRKSPEITLLYPEGDG